MGMHRSFKAKDSEEAIRAREVLVGYSGSRDPPNARTASGVILPGGVDTFSLSDDPSGCRTGRMPGTDGLLNARNFLL